MHSDKIKNLFNKFDQISQFNAHLLRLQFIKSKFFGFDRGNMKISLHENHTETCVWCNDVTT